MVGIRLSRKGPVLLMCVIIVTIFMIQLYLASYLYLYSSVFMHYRVVFKILLAVGSTELSLRGNENLTVIWRLYS
jgi:hypothetical protein